MTETFARNNGKVFKLLERIGVSFKDPESGKYKRVAGVGDDHPVWINFEGRDIKRILSKYLDKVGILALSRIFVQRLLVDNNGVCGAVGFHIRSGELYVFKSKAVIIGTGGVQRLFPASSGTVYASLNSPFNCGDGHAMAFNAGAKLSNMEFAACSIVPIGFHSPGITGFVGLGATIINALGERFMKKYHPWGEHAPRNTVVRALLKEYEEGRGPCFVDFTNMSEEAQTRVLTGIKNEKGVFLDFLNAKGLNIRKNPIPFEVQELFLNGSGIMINEKCHSSLPGLLSAGDCTDWAFGAAAAFTLGYIAGVEAAQYSKTAVFRDMNYGTLEDLGQLIFSPINREGGVAPQDFEEEIRKIAGANLSLKRNAEGLSYAIEALNALALKKPELKAKNLHELMKVYEASNLLEIARIVARAAWERKETRGVPSHVRVDYPERDDANWFGFVAIKKASNEISTEYIPIQ